jgi:hypothetical protein
MALIRDCTARGLSPGQTVATRPGPGLSRPAVCERVGRGYGDMGSVGLRRKVGHGPRRRAGGGAGTTRRSAERPREAFLGLPGDVRDGAVFVNVVIAGLST